MSRRRPAGRPSRRHAALARAWSPALALWLGACGSFTAGVEEPDIQAEARSVGTQVRVGETRRDEVHARLGQPLFASDGSGVELHARETKDASTDWLVVGIVPVPGWTQVRRYRLYPLVVYDAAGTVRGVDAGWYAEHHAQDQPLKVPDSRSVEVAGFTLRVDPCAEPGCLALVAPADASAPVLRRPPDPGLCSLVLAQPPPGTRVELDGQVLLENLGAGADASSASDAHWFARAQAQPGAHALRATPTANALIATGEVTHALTCRAGDVLVVRFKRVLAPSDDVLDRIQLRGAFEIAGVEVLPADARAILYARGRAFDAAGPLRSLTSVPAD